MSDAQNIQDHDGAHEGPIKTPKQLILAVFFSFVVPIAAIVLLVIYVTSSYRPAAGTRSLEPEAVARRIQPVGQVEVRDMAYLASMKTGEQVYQAQCSACHTAGVAGAPKLGDVDAWSARLKTGYDALLTSALKGKGAMGPQGGGDFADLEIARAVVFVANKAGGKFEEPKAPAAGAAAGTGAAPAAAASMAAAATTAAPATPAVAAPTPANAAAPAAAPTQPAAPAQNPATPAQTAAGTPAPAPAQAVAAAGAAAPAAYTQVCAVCHVAGVGGAPKTGDKAAWAPRLALGIDELTASVIKGKGAMPPRGGSQASDAELKDAVNYLVNQSR